MNETSNLQGSDKQSKLSPAKRHIKAFRATNDYVAKLIVGPAIIKEDRFTINQVRPGQLPEGFSIMGSWYEHPRSCFYIIIEHPSFPEHTQGTPIPEIELEACDIQVDRVTPESEELDRLTCESAKSAIGENEDFRKAMAKLELDKANLQGWIQRAIEQIEEVPGMRSVVSMGSENPARTALRMLRSALRGDDILGIVNSGSSKRSDILGPAHFGVVEAGERNVQERLKKVVAFYTLANAPEIKLTSKLEGSALMGEGIFFSMIVKVEQEFHIQIYHSEAWEVSTFGDLLVLVTAKLDALP